MIAHTRHILQSSQQDCVGHQVTIFGAKGPCTVHTQVVIWLRRVCFSHRIRIVNQMQAHSERARICQRTIGSR